jgi:hypothetical protein
VHNGPGDERVGVKPEYNREGLGFGLTLDIVSDVVPLLAGATAGLAVVGFRFRELGWVFLGGGRFGLQEFNNFDLLLLVSKVFALLPRIIVSGMILIVSVNDKDNKIVKIFI